MHDAFITQLFMMWFRFWSTHDAGLDFLVELKPNNHSTSIDIFNFYCRQKQQKICILEQYSKGKLSFSHYPKTIEEDKMKRHCMIILQTCQRDINLVWLKIKASHMDHTTTGKLVCSNLFMGLKNEKHHTRKQISKNSWKPLL